MLQSCKALTNGRKLFVLCDLNMLQTHTVELHKLQKTNNSWMKLFPDKMYPALSFKCMISSPGMNANKLPYMELTKLSLRNSFDHQTVLCIKTSMICTIRYACSNHIIFRRNFGYKTYRDLRLDNQNKAFIFL